MDTELVNMFVTKQRDVINDLMSKNILLEARIAIAEKHMQQMEALRQQLSAYEQEIAEWRSAMQELQQKHDELLNQTVVTIQSDRGITNDEFIELGGLK